MRQAAVRTFHLVNPIDFPPAVSLILGASTSLVELRTHPDENTASLIAIVRPRPEAKQSEIPLASCTRFREESTASKTKLASPWSIRKLGRATGLQNEYWLKGRRNQ